MRRSRAMAHGGQSPSPTWDADRFPCGLRSRDGRWRLSRTLLSVRGPDGEERRLAGLTVPVSGIVLDGGEALILDRIDPLVGLHRLVLHGPDGRIWARRVRGRHLRLVADPGRRRAYLIVEDLPGRQTLHALDLDEGARLWHRDLRLERPSLAVVPSTGELYVRHRRSPPGFPYVYRFAPNGQVGGRLPLDGAHLSRLVRAAHQVGREDTARRLLDYLGPVPGGLPPGGGSARPLRGA